MRFWLDGADRGDQLTDVVFVARRAMRCEVGVSGQPPDVVGRQQHSALEHHPISVLGGGQAPQERLHRVDHQQRLGIAAVLAAGLGLQGLERRPGGLVDEIPFGQLRSASNAGFNWAPPPSSRASSARRAGLALGRLRYRPSACSPTSRPTHRDIRIASRIVRSAE